MLNSGFYASNPRRITDALAAQAAVCDRSTGVGLGVNQLCSVSWEKTVASKLL